MLAAALFALGMFAAIYHPVGTAMLIETATQRGRSLAFNGVCGNLGVSLAAGITAVLTAAFSWRGAFLVPGLIAIATGVAYVWLAPDEERHKPVRAQTSDAPIVPLVQRAVARRRDLRPVHGGRADRRPGVQHADGGVAEDRRRARRRHLARRGRRPVTAVFLCGASPRSRSAAWSSAFGCIFCSPCWPSCSSRAWCGRPMRAA